MRGVCSNARRCQRTCGRASLPISLMIDAGREKKKNFF
jgi:hypothetical protein